MPQSEDLKQIVTFEECLLLKEEYEKKLELIEKQHKKEIELLKSKIFLLQQQLQHQ